METGTVKLPKVSPNIGRWTMPASLSSLRLLGPRGPLQLWNRHPLLMTLSPLSCHYRISRYFPISRMFPRSEIFTGSYYSWLYTFFIYSEFQWVEFCSQRYLLMNTRSKSDTIPIKVGIRVERNCQTNWDPSLLTTKCLDTPYKKPHTITHIYEWWKNISSTTATPGSQFGFVLTPARRTGLIQWYWFVRNAPNTGVAVRQLRRHPGTSDNGCYQRVQQHLGWNDEIPIHAKSELIDAPPNPK